MSRERARMLKQVGARALMCIGTRSARVTIAALGLLTFYRSAAEEPEAIHVHAFDLPRYSDFLSAETRAGIERQRALHAQAAKLCDPSTKTTGADIRACEAQMYPPIITEARKKYDVRIEARTIGGIYTDVVSPAEGVSKKNARRVLINAHGGAFLYGARFGGQLEAMPIAAIGKYKVVAVDYRMGPEHQFPAASEDLAAVYQELLKEFDASQIGLYGCSAGGRIVGQTVAWMAQHKLPRPGAVAMLCSVPIRFGGDSQTISAAITGRPPRVRDFKAGYFKGVDPADPIAFAGEVDETLAKFPPSILITSTRDYSMSPVIQMHASLIRLGVPAELHIFEGLGHAEFLNMYIPESRQAARIVATFFDAHLN
jgi:epsilon-lactone hydrolase